MPSVSIDGGVEKCTALLCVLRSPPNCETVTNTGLHKIRSVDLCFRTNNINISVLLYWRYSLRCEGPPYPEDVVDVQRARNITRY